MSKRISAKTKRIRKMETGHGKDYIPYRKDKHINSMVELKKVTANIMALYDEYTDRPIEEAFNKVIVRKSLLGILIIQR